MLEDALAAITRRSASLTVAGRTDAGVHATGQVAHLDASPETLCPELLVHRLARFLPPDLRVPAVQQVPRTFDARFSALRRHYRYRVCDAPWGVDPLRRYDTLGHPRRLDDVMMNTASALLLGEHDFAAFCHSMVRSLVGALLAVGEHRRPPDWPAALLRHTTRTSEVTVAPAHGLTLIGVDYPADDQLADRAEQTRAVRQRQASMSSSPDTLRRP